MSRLLSRYGCVSRTSQTVTKNSSCVLTYLRSTLLLRERDQNPSKFKVSSCCFWSRTHFICASQASVPSVRCHFAFGSGSTGSCKKAVLTFSNADNFVLLGEGKPAAWSFCGRLFSGAAILAMFGTNCRNTLQNPRKDPISVRNVSG